MTQYGQPPHQPNYGPPPQIGYQPGGGGGSRRANGLGIASLVLGIVALAAAMVPCCGMVFAIPLGIIGGALGLVGFIAAGSDGQTGRGMPLSGMIVSLAALAITFAWPFVLSAISPPAPPTIPGGTTLPTTQPATTDPAESDDMTDEPSDPSPEASPSPAPKPAPKASPAARPTTGPARRGVGAGG
jgi:hypothetical protein